jgi:hypothetical protein
MSGLFGFTENVANILKRMAMERLNNGDVTLTGGLPRFHQQQRGYVAIPMQDIPGARQINGKLHVGSGIVKILTRRRDPYYEWGSAQLPENTVSSKVLIPRQSALNLPVYRRVFNYCRKRIHRFTDYSCTSFEFGVDNDIYQPILFCQQDSFGDLWVINECCQPKDESSSSLSTSSVSLSSQSFSSTSFSSSLSSISQSISPSTSPSTSQPSSGGSNPGSLSSSQGNNGLPGCCEDEFGDPVFPPAGYTLTMTGTGTCNCFDGTYTDGFTIEMCDDATYQSLPVLTCTVYEDGKAFRLNFNRCFTGTSEPYSGRARLTLLSCDPFHAVGTMEMYAATSPTNPQQELECCVGTLTIEITE